jgi:putative membrane-bound dehydrogenase-like protein
LPPAEAIRTLRLADPALASELVAAEPDVADPVAVAWDEMGRMYVAEMGDYPTGPPAGRIKRLEDRDGDGRMDRSLVFADKLTFPTSVLPWSGGVLVAAAPDILFLKDRDGDGRADVRQVLFTGFGEGNQQLRVNGLIWGLDGWVYGANGRSDGAVRRVAPAPAAAPPNPRRADPLANAAVSIRHRDFRFRPDTLQFEATAGFTQFGHGFDDFGRRFLSWNTVHIRHVVLEQSYIERNPALAAPVPTQEISDHGSTSRVFPISETTRRFNAEPPGYFNASCGLTVYRGDALPASYRGSAFMCEPLSNLVHRDVLVPAGATFLARRGEENVEFLASPDRWFRPVNLATGPDGALYVVDFYRALVEHPAFVRDGAPGVDFREGSDRGRIYRIVPKDWRRPAPVDWSAASPEPLARALEHSNGWVRETAARLIVERRERRAIEPLRQIAAVGASAAGRVAALRTLDALGALDESLVLDALHSSDAGVCEHAIQLAEPRLTSTPALARALLGLTDHRHPRIRFQLACTLGAARPEPDVIAALARIARRDCVNPWIALAVLSSLRESAGGFLREFVEPRELPDADTTRFAREAAGLVGARNVDIELANLVHYLASLDGPAGSVWQLAILGGLGEGQRRAGRSLGTWATAPNEPLRTAAAQVAAIEQTALRVAAAESAPPHVRAAAIRVVGSSRAERAHAILAALLDPQHGRDVQLAAVEALSHRPEPAVADTLLAGWSAQTPVVRRAVLDAVFARRDRVGRVVAALDAGRLAPADLDATHAELLLRLADGASRPRVQKLLDRPPAGDRSAVVDAHRAALRLDANAARGADVFLKRCATCHAVQGRGNRVGPDLASVTQRSPDELLADILDPNRSVVPDGINYIVATHDGRIVSGIIAAETATSITLRRAEAAEDTVLRGEIEEMQSTRRSLMPEGLEKELTAQDLADVIAFLRKGA